VTGPISPSQFHATEGVEDWRVVSDGATAFFRTRSLAEGARLAQRIAELDGVEDRRPAIDLRRDSVTVRLVTLTDAFMGVTSREVELARRISEIARDLGITADPSRVQSLLVIPGAPDITSIVPFWRVVLGYEPRPDSPDEDLVDPRDRGPGFWFEGMQQPRGDGGGAIHLAVWVGPEQAEARVAAALAAGGHLVRDDYAPAWWTLADAAGNELDVATTDGRD
jgi:4a-hydroxytetrahydrobiopterin dehydratase